MGLRRQVSLSVSSCPLSGEAPVGLGERKRRRAPDFREPLPKLQRVPCRRQGGLPLLTVSLPAQESMSVGGEEPGLTAVQGWVGMVGPRAGPAYASA